MIMNEEVRWYAMAPGVTRPRLRHVLDVLAARARAKVARDLTWGPGDAWSVIVMRAEGANARVGVYAAFDPTGADVQVEPSARLVTNGHDGGLHEALCALGFAPTETPPPERRALEAVMDRS